MTSGGSVLETCADLKKAGLTVSHAVVLLDREQGGRGNIEREGVTLTSVLTMTQLLQHLQNAGKITMETVAMVKDFISENSTVKVPLPSAVMNAGHPSFTERAQSSSNPLAKRLLQLMEQKSTNLALSADVSTSSELIEVSCPSVYNSPDSMGGGGGGILFGEGELMLTQPIHTNWMTNDLRAYSVSKILH